MSQFKINDELIDRIKKLILSKDKSKVIEKLKDVHYADLAEIFESLEISEVVYIIKIFDKQKSADALAELDEDIREGIKEFSDWPTIPQLYIDKKFVGGCDIVKEMFEKGELQKILNLN